MFLIMELIKAVRIQGKRGVPGVVLLRTMLAVSLIGSLSLFSGCKQHDPADVVAAQKRNLSPDQIETLKQLTAALRQTRHRQIIMNTFEDFVAARSDLTIPPPPPGKKYVINKKYDVVDLVDAH
jgi:hypothetical protein